MEQALIDGLRLTAERRVDEEYLAELRRGDREAFAAELFARSVTAGAAVVDCRAYLGFHSLLAGRRVGPDGIVFAFEPDPTSFDAMRRNVRDNGLEDRVAALPLSLADSSLDEILGGRPVAALRGMRTTLAASPNPCALVACDPTALSRAGTSVRTVLRELDAAGLEPAAIDESDWRLLALERLVPPPRSPVSLYCRRT